ncbi:MAG: tRNA uridine-5-carboxymethylaminomethyl(34) synthesis GTPase MnmE [Vicinamibacterales bacterium]
MFTTDDTIVAIATPPGRGGIGVVRISGPSAHPIAQQLTTHKARFEPRRATFTKVGPSDPSTLGPLDQVVVTLFEAPASYTGQDVVEISAHGAPVVLQGIVRAAMEAGARLARPGEFTLRAFLNGKRDLIQAEAVADLIAAATPLQARVAFDQLEGTLTRRITEIDAVLFDLIARLEASLDFPDEGYHFVGATETADALDRLIEEFDRLLADAGCGRMIREGATVVLAGRPNVGKSSLFNALAGAERAIVTAVPGTTRDLVTEVVDVGGIPVMLVDTAGWRETDDIVEREGVARGEQARGVAALTIVVLDGSEDLTAEDEQLLEATSGRRRVVVANKADLPGTGVGAGFRRPVEVSARTGAGLDELREALASALTGDEPLRDTAVVTNARHIHLLADARGHLATASAAARAGDTPEEFLLTDLQAARAKLDEVVGVRTPEDVLQHIFERFCIGK